VRIEHARLPSGEGGRVWLVVLWPDPASADPPDGADDQVLDDPGMRWAEVASRVVGPTGPRFGRWQQVMVDALAGGRRGWRSLCGGGSPGTQGPKGGERGSPPSSAPGTCLREIAGRGSLGSSAACAA
jgi:hypothetical protein